MNAPPVTSPKMLLPSKNSRSSRPKMLAATSCGMTMKKLNIPMYTPIFRAGRMLESNT